MPNKINISQTNNLIPFIAYFEQHGIAWRDIASQHHIPQDLTSKSAWVPTQHAMNFLMAMVASTQKKIGLEVGRLISIQQISPELDRSLSNYDDLASAIHHIIEVMPEFSSHIVLWVECINGQWFLCHRGAYRPTMPGYDQAEWFRSFALLSFCRKFNGASWKPNQVLMSSPAHLNKNLPKSFAPVKFSFGEPYGALSIDLPADFIPFNTLSTGKNWLNNIKNLIDTYATLPWFNITWFVKQIDMSARSFQRRLTENNTSFRALRDQSRCKAAKSMLNEEGLSPSETAWRCGYNDPSNFNRAFIGWTGQTPARYQALNSK
ncbi:hypothetical protein BCU70_09785 [Vibrio sp. 10N.286.49.C2]|uniref:helix-turn-helix domain-containing protein n=1 Tax=unclassified Vibrio TaxID=2614977 RepID=UPI000C860686|nr:MULTISPECIES: helix-turn-helix domain-containing protein [unclassified Vibrio]PMH26431.1 hypothetical protein BCU70_09785 [Vibrio sp. 10N.286.49.C2]PMH54845.1 hypothetical protein BCU66_11150 [Vibrio sp. 10N.286.49.B1]PMH82101.1 hypothetical protein BCU58_19385 [Vibrio sp. 10N.286.48.B7]